MAPKIKLLANADKTGNPKGPTNRRFPTRIFTLSHTIKIGVIDDDDLVRGAIDSLIQSLGYEVDTFTSAADYLSSNRLHDHSCIIADLQMTGITGTDFQKQLMSKGFSTANYFYRGLLHAGARETRDRGRRHRLSAQTVQGRAFARIFGQSA